MALVSSGKNEKKDQKFDDNEESSNFSNIAFVRLVAKGKTFTRVDFRYTLFDACYLRDCRFDSCDFTGCRFVNTSLQGSKFAGCKFDYASFERTLIDANVLDTECPGHENLKSRFARSLRVNFQQLGDAVGANKAMKVELSATSIHLQKAAWSNERYYRLHYRGWQRLRIAAEWFEFRTLDFIWGNGESIWRLLRFVLIVLGLMTLVDVTQNDDPRLVSSYLYGFVKSFAVFFGAVSPTNYWPSAIATIICVRLVTVGFFLSIIIKKFNRR
jgi:hypothetical protein